MKAPLSWLREFVEINVDVETLCEKLVSVGFEVEELIDLSKSFSGVVVGCIKEIEQHPNADKLKVCQVDIGEKTVQIVTNAKNLAVGNKVPVSLDGAVLADGTQIKSGELRGVKSEGMFCGGEELAADDSVYPGASEDGVLVLSDEEVIGTSMTEVLGYNDYVLDVGVTPNRPDCNSIWGIAREVAVALGTSCRTPEISFTETEGTDIADYVKVEVQATDLCPNYNMQAVCDVKIAKSPLWMTRRLKAVGIRGINNLVDITNYVLMEIGQPMHAFDQSDINNKTIIVRRANAGEKIIPLDKKEYELNSDVLVIADAEKPVGLAGIMGGNNSGIKDDTSAVVFESANFKKENIRRSSRNLGIRSDSSARFEKGVDAFSVDFALSRALHLIEKLNAGKVVKGRIAIGKPAEKRVVEFPFSRIKWLLGIEVPENEVKKILTNLGVEASIEGENLKCIVPEYRDDLEADCDIIEEIIRVYGYDNITPTLLEHAEITKGGRTEEQSRLDLLKQFFIGKGFNEIITYSFCGKSLYEKLGINVEETPIVKIRNPLGEEFSLMRTTLAGHMLNIIASNLNKKNSDLRLFEVGKRYIPKQLPMTELPDEINTLSLGICEEKADFFSLMRPIRMMLDEVNVEFTVKRSQVAHMHPGVSADLFVGEEYLGYVGKIHPEVKENFGIDKDVFIAEINLDVLNKHALVYKKYVSFGRYPTSSRDLAVLVDKKVLAGEMLENIKAASNLIKTARLFDVYESQALGDKRSLAFSIVFGSDERTLKDEEIEAATVRILKILEEKFEAKLRS